MGGTLSQTMNTDKDDGRLQLPGDGKECLDQLLPLADVFGGERGGADVEECGVGLMRDGFCLGAVRRRRGRPRREVGLAKCI